MSNSIWLTIGLWAGGIAGAPFTGGLSLIASGVGAVRIAGHAIEASQSHWCDVRDRVPESIKDQKVIEAELRYCHLVGEDIWGEAGDAGLTLLNRATLMGTDAAHHHYLIVTLESGVRIYVDKHAYRNFAVTTHNQGLKPSAQRFDDGEFYEHSERLYRVDAGRTITLRQLMEHGSQSRFGHYELLTTNCQDYAKRMSKWIASTYDY